MANKKITDFTALTTPASGDFLEIVDVSDVTDNAAGSSRKITTSNLSKSITPEGTNVLSTGEAGGVKFLREDGDGTSSWQAIPGGGDALTTSPLSQFAATTSLQLKGVISDETGSGALAFATSPTLVTPDIGVATATSVNKVAITAPATGSTITIPDGVTLTGPAASGTAMTLGNTETVTGAKTFGSAGAVSKLKIAGTTSGAITLDTEAVAGTAVVTVPAATDTLVGKATTDTLTNKTIDANGTGNSISNIEVADMAATAVVTAGEGLASSDNDTSIPTTAAVIDGLDTKQAAGATLSSLEGLTLGAGDMLYATAADTLTDLAIGTASQVLAVNAGATAPEWVTISSGGQSTFDKIVAPSGGDYTTLGAAITAASNGWSIFVKEGTYTESAITTSLTNLTIVGENPRTTILDGSSNTLTFSGTGVVFKNIGATFTTGGFVFSGAYHVAQLCEFIGTGIGTVYSNTGATSRVINCSIQNTLAAVGNNTVPLVKLHSASGIYDSNYFVVNSYNASTANAGISFNAGNQATFSNNIVKSNVNGTTGNLLSFSGSGNIIGNQFLGKSTEVCIAQTGGYANIANNICTSSDKFILQTSGDLSSITGNRASFSTTGITLVGSNQTVSGNIIGNGSGGGTTGVSISAGYSFNSITGNQIDAGTTGFNVASSTTSRGNSFVGNTVTTATTPVADAGVGTTIKNNTGVSALFEKEFAYMKNTSGGSLAAGDVVTYKAVAAGNEVTTTTTASDNLVFGMAQEAILNNASGFIQTRGKTTQLKVNGTTDIAIGDFLTTFTTAKIAAKAATGNRAFAIALEAYITDDSNGVVDALLTSPVNFI